MKKSMMAACTIALFAAAPAMARDVKVNGYMRSDGTYVQGHTRSQPDQYRYNNYGSQLNGRQQRDEYSSGFNSSRKSSMAYGMSDDDGDGIPNATDINPRSRNNNLLNP